MSLPEFGGMDTGFNWYHDADPAEYDLLLSNSGGCARAAARTRGAGAPRPCSGAPTPVLRAAGGRQGARRLLLRLRGQVSPRVGRGDGGAAVAGLPGRRLRARRTRLPGRTGRARLIGDVSFNTLPASSRPPGSTCASRAVRTPACTRRRLAGRSSSRPRAPPSCRIRTRESSAGSSPGPS